MANAQNKRYLKCQSENALDQFYAHKRTLDGYSNNGKECTKKIGWERSSVSLKPKTAMKAQEEKAASPKKRPPGDQRRYRARHPERCRAHSIVARAIAKGTLVKSRCAVCGMKDDIEAHHTDYSRPLDVRWLCWYHHKREHGFLNPERFARDMFMLI